MKNKEDDLEKTPLQKVKDWAKLILSIYSFILLLDLIKKASLYLAPDIKDFLVNNIGPLKATSLGWFATSLVQSSGAVESTVAAFVGNNLLSMEIAIYILIGASLGTTITAIIISIITQAKKRRDFRHGFEIAISYSIYNFLLIIIVFILEYFTKFFSKTSYLIASKIGEEIPLFIIPNILGSITEPVSNIILLNFSKILILILSFLFLILILKNIGKSMIQVLGGEKKAKRVINKKFKNKYHAYFLGFIITVLAFSSSVTISLLIPLAISRVINLKKALPFMIGANLGTSIDVLFAAVLIGKIGALAVFFAVFLFAIVGALIFLPNINILFKLTKYTSKHLIHISRKKALFVLLVFILIPLALILIL